MGNDVVQIRRGDTFKARGTYMNKETKTPADLSSTGDVTIYAYVTATNEFRMEMAVVGQADGTFTVRCDTDSWPLGKVVWFMRYISSDGDKTSSPLMDIFVNDGHN